MACLPMTVFHLPGYGVALQVKALRELARQVKLSVAEKSDDDMDISAWLIQVLGQVAAAQ